MKDFNKIFYDILLKIESNNKKKVNTLEIKIDTQLFSLL